MVLFRRCAGSLAAMALALLFSSGCSNRGSEATLSGQVLIDGKPLKGGSLIFVPTAPGTKNAFAMIDESGNYGPLVVAAGEVMIGVDNRGLAPHQSAGGGGPPAPKGASSDLRAKMAARKASPPPPPNPNYTPIPEKYYQAETSGLTVTAQAGEQKHNIELSSK